MSRKDELLKIFKDVDENVLTIVEPMIDELIFVEARLEELKEKPFIKYHPKDPTIQKATASGKLYKELLSQEKDIVKILCSQLHKGGSDDNESPLRAFLKGFEK